MKSKWDKSFTSKVVNAVTKSVQNSGKSFLTNTESTLLVLITATLIFNSKELTSIITKPQEEDMYQEQSLWTYNLEPWTQSGLDPLGNFLGQTTLFSDKLEPETTGLKVTIPKELNLLIQFWTSLEKKLKDATVFKVSKSPILSVVEQVQEWELFLFLKSDKNILIESCKLFQWSPPQKYQIPSFNPTMLLFLSIS